MPDATAASAQTSSRCSMVQPSDSSNVFTIEYAARSR